MRILKLLLFLTVNFVGHVAAKETIEVNLAKLDEGSFIGVDIEGGPYYIVKRSPEELELLTSTYGENNLRSEKNKFVVVEATSPDSGCAVVYIPKGSKKLCGHPVSEVGGFVDMCSCAWFDLTGRRKSYECPGKDMEIAPHKFLDDTVVVVGYSPHDE